MNARVLAAVVLLLVCARAVRGQADAAPPSRVYTMTLEGTFGRQVALAPIRDAMAEAKTLHPEVLLVRFECDYAPGPSDATVADTTALDQLELARQLDPVMTDAIREDREWSPKPRVVFWVKKAQGGAGYLAFISREIYYTTDATHSCPGSSLEEDKMAREKHRSLRHSRVQGMALKGGNRVELLNAMTRRDYVLSVDIRGASVTFHESLAGEVLLTDDKDLLVLDAAMALRLGLSKGTVDTKAELFRAMGLDASKVEEIGTSYPIFARWRTGLAAADKEFAEILTAVRAVQVAPPGGYDQRQAARDERRALIRRANEILDTYGDSLDPAVLATDPPKARAMLKVLSDAIDEAQRLDRK